MALRMFLDKQVRYSSALNISSARLMAQNSTTFGMIVWRISAWVTVTYFKAYFVPLPLLTMDQPPLLVYQMIAQGRRVTRRAASSFNQALRYK